jgi:hypothetical protein
VAKRRVANAVANRVVFFLVAARRTAALQRTECARNRAQCSPWSMAVSALRLVPKARATRQFLHILLRAARAADDGQATHGWPSQRRPICPDAASLANSCRMPRPCRAAGEQPPRESTILIVPSCRL